MALLFGIQMLNAQVVMFDDYIKELKNQKSVTKVDEVKHLNSLAFDYHPSFYIKNNQVVTIDSKTPICGEIDFDDFQTLSTPNSKFESVEFLTVYLRTPKTQRVNLDLLSNMKNLKYIHFICDYSCNSSSIEKLLGRNNTEIKLLYSIIIPN